MAVTEDDTDLRGGGTGRFKSDYCWITSIEQHNIPLSGELADLVGDLVRSGLEPGRRSPGVRNGRGGDTLSLGVKTETVVRN